MPDTLRWSELPLAVIDTETTGTDPATARIWEIGIRFVGGDRNGKQTSTLVRPPEAIPQEVIELCGLQPEDLKAVQQAPPFEAVAERLLGHLRDRVLVGYNLLTYDLPVLRAELARCSPAPPAPELDGPTIDALVATRHFLRHLRSRRLSSVAEALGVPIPANVHRTLADVRMTAGVLGRLAPRLPQGLEELLRVQAEWLELQEKESAEFGYWLYRDRSDERLRMGAGKHCGLALDEVDPSYLFYLLRAHGDWDRPLPEGVVAEFERAVQAVSAG